MIKPLYDKVVLKVQEMTKTTASGFVLPDSDEKSNLATVIAVGPGKEVDGKLQPLTVKVDDTVLFSKYAGSEVKVDGEEYLVVSEKDILAVME